MEERDREARQAELLTQLKQAQPAVPQQVTIQQQKLPQMREKDDIELFVHHSLRQLC